MATDFIRINSFHVCKKFNLSKYVCELPPEKRICDGVCIKLPEADTSGELAGSAENKVNV